MQVVTYEGVVENGCVRLPPGSFLPEKAKVYVVVPEMTIPSMVHMRSPRLADPSKAAELLKVEVIDERPDAGA
jgi:hypothetical protein